jgi:hypothetical protein
MTVNTNDVPKLSILEHVKMHVMQYKAQRDQAQANLHQLHGAIHALEETIKKMEEDGSKDEIVELIEP